MRDFELVEKFPRGPGVSFFRTFRTPPDTFLGADAGSNIKESLIGFGLLRENGCFPLHSCVQRDACSF